MKNQPVRSWMTTSPISVTPETTLPEARNLMKEFNVRRLPVVKHGELVGIVTFGDIREAQPSDASALSIYELNYLLENLKIKEFMTPNPITITPDATIAEAARIMLDFKVGGLPVLQDGVLVGIITETDFCRLIVTDEEDLLRETSAENLAHGFV